MTPDDIIGMARSAKSFYMASAEDDAPPPTDETFMRASVAFSMLMRMGDIMPEMAIVVTPLDSMNRDHAITSIAVNFSDVPASTPERAKLFSAALPDDYAAAMRAVVAGNRRALGLAPQE